MVRLTFNSSTSGINGGQVTVGISLINEPWTAGVPFTKDFAFWEVPVFWTITIKEYGGNTFSYIDNVRLIAL